MKVFLGWSGQLSHKVALALHDWLPNVVQAVKPFVSSEDIAKGARWAGSIAKELQSSNYGIICVTKENSDSPWINFEAGALSREIEKASVTPFLFNVRPSELKGPLDQFQWVVNEREDMLKLVTSINEKLEPENKLAKDKVELAFRMWWPKLSEAWGKLDAEQETKPKPEKRDQSLLLEQLLDLIKSQQRGLEQRLSEQTFRQEKQTTALLYRFEELSTTVSTIARSLENAYAQLDPFYSLPTTSHIPTAPEVSLPPSVSDPPVVAVPILPAHKLLRKRSVTYPRAEAPSPAKDNGAETQNPPASR